MQKIYTGISTAKGGRAGHVTSFDQTLDFDLSLPKALGGTEKAGTTNPEQLFASGYAACFGSALDFVAKQKKLTVSAIEVTAEVSLLQGSDGFNLSAVLKAHLPPLDKAQTLALMEEAHNHVCPYSKATRNNIEVSLEAI